MSRILIEYLPDLSEEGLRIISEHITPSMTSYEGDYHQYCLDFVINDVLTELCVEDQNLLLSLQEENVEYIEF